MKIVVALKQVIARDSVLRLSADARWVDETDAAYEINEADAYALEAGLQLKEKQGGEVIALCAGPGRVSKAIREALAKGADRAIHIALDQPEQLDSLATARLLVEAVRQEGPDLVLTGLQSDDVGAGQTGVVAAELLGWPHVTLVVGIEPAGGGLRVRRELEGGWFQYVETPLPAVLTIQSGIARLRYATLMGIKRARSKEVRRIDARELLPQNETAAPIVRLREAEKTKQTQILEGPPAEAAAKLVEKLKFEARVL